MLSLLGVAVFETWTHTQIQIGECYDSLVTNYDMTDSINL